MLNFHILFALSLVLVVVSSDVSKLSSRNVLRGGETGMVNLVEFNIRGTIYGKCSFRHEGDEVAVGISGFRIKKFSRAAQ